MFYIFNKVTQRYMKKAFTSYEAGRAHARKLIRTGKYGTYLSWSWPSRNPPLSAYGLQVVSK